MNSQLHLLIVTTLSMMMTFGLYYTLKDTRPVDSFLQKTLINTTRDSILFVRYLFNTKTTSKRPTFPSLDNRSNRNFSTLIFLLSTTTCIIFHLYKKDHLMFRLIRTIIAGWYFACFCGTFHIWCEFDTFTGYFLIWQAMSLVTKWEKEHFPIFSLDVYRGWLCMSSAFEAFFLYDAIFQNLPLWINFVYIWFSSVEDIIACLHPKGYLYQRKPIEEISKGIQSVARDFYYTWDADDSQSNRQGNRSTLGLGDFVMFNLMLLFILNPLSSIRRNVCIAIGHIIAVQIGQLATHRLGIYYNRYEQPALPLSVITFSIYAVILLDSVRE